MMLNNYQINATITDNLATVTLSLEDYQCEKYTGEPSELSKLLAQAVSEIESLELEYESMILETMYQMAADA